MKFICLINIFDTEKTQLISLCESLAENKARASCSVLQKNERIQ